VKYLAIALIAVPALAAALAGDVWLDEGTASEWGGCGALILLWCAVVWRRTEQHDLR